MDPTPIVPTELVDFINPFSMMDYLRTTISPIFGEVSPWFLGLIFIGVMVFVHLILFRLTGSFLLASLGLGPVIIMGVWMGFIPMWMAFILAFPITFFLFYTISADFGFGSGREEKVKKPKTITITLTRPEFQKKIQRLAEMTEQYHNNLDDLLGVRSYVARDSALYFMWTKPVRLGLPDNWDDPHRLVLNQTNFDLYLTEVSTDPVRVVIVAFNKEFKARDKAYVIKKDQKTGYPTLRELPKSYIKRLQQEKITK